MVKAAEFQTIGIAVLLLSVPSHSAMAATLCVNQGGTDGCFRSIGSAVSAASPGDTIQVARGTYKEYVVVPKSISLIGESQENTIIDALDKPFGINVDGFNNPGLNAVVISGFTIRNANNAGIVVSNASKVTVSENSVLDNNRGLAANDPDKCQSLVGFPYFAKSADCGESIFLSGVVHSGIVNNKITADGEKGGILISDETGPTYDNLVGGNAVVFRKWTAGRASERMTAVQPDCFRKPGTNPPCPEKQGNNRRGSLQWLNLAGMPLPENSGRSGMLGRRLRCQIRL